ncbi:MAG: carboxymuconolactone decarboxylase family protein [Betaproteobacteria bacterium]|nr:carboxymuconolactone decarboxylase family protein [Betaproteobacteria bacterium]
MDAAVKPRIGGFPPGRYPWYLRLIFWLQRRKYGCELEPALLWGRMPRAFLILTLLYRSLDRPASPLDPELRSLVQVRISQINWCEFCVDLKIVELTALIAFQNLSSKFNAALGVPAHGFCATPPGTSP